MPAAGREPPSLWLALTTLHAARRTTLLDDVEAALASIEARHNPLLFDIADESDEDPFGRARSWFLPALTAAHSLLVGRYRTPTDFWVEALPRGTAPHPSDVPAWGNDSEGPVARRARQLAWAIARAVLVRDAPGRAHRSLREAAADPASSIALVVTRDDLAKRRDGRVVELLGRLSGAGADVSGGKSRLPLRVPTENEDVLPWLVLEPDHALVVPRLAALAPRARFVDEVRAQAQRHGAKLVHAGDRFG